MNESRITTLNNIIANSNRAVREAQAELHTLTKHTPDAEEVKATREAARAEKYATKNGLSITRLKELGYDITVSHIRNTLVKIGEGVGSKGNIQDILIPVPIPAYLKHQFTPSARGGATHIIISVPVDERELEGAGEWVGLTSICHADDAFDYKLGVKTALDTITPEEAADLITNAPGETLEQWKERTNPEKTLASATVVCSCGH